MLTMGLDKQFSRILIAAGILNVVVGIPLISMFAAQGAGASVLLTETVVTLSMGIILQRNGISIRMRRAVAA
jgi:heme A synthase